MQHSAKFYSECVAGWICSVGCRSTHCPNTLLNEALRKDAAHSQGVADIVAAEATPQPTGHNTDTQVEAAAAAEGDAVAGESLGARQAGEAMPMFTRC